MDFDLKSVNVVVGQSGGPTAVINASLAGVYETAKKMGARKIYGMRYGITGFMEERLVDLAEKLQDSFSVELLKRTPASFLGSCRYKLPEPELNNPVYTKIFEVLNKYEIKVFIYIGGNDSMDTIKKLSDYGELIHSDVRFMGVPKTIDNDLAVTDHTPGYASAAKYVCTSLRELKLDADVYDLKSVTVVEIMGRNAGWLTAAASLVQGDPVPAVDLIYLPEVPFYSEKCLESVKKLLEKKNTVMIAVSEGITDEKGDFIFAQTGNNARIDAFGHRLLSGVGQHLAGYLKENLKVKVRSIELNTLQRCGSHIASLTDVNEAFQAGGAALEAAFEGKTGQMVILKRISDDPYGCVTETYDVHRIANLVKTVPVQWINEEQNGVTEDFIRYARPLISGELNPVTVEGLPIHLMLQEDNQ